MCVVCVREKLGLKFLEIESLDLTYTYWKSWIIVDSVCMSSLIVSEGGDQGEGGWYSFPCKDINRMVLVPFQR